MSVSRYKPNELDLALRIAKKLLDRAMEEKPNGGLVANKGTPYEAKLSYHEAKLCMERLERKFGMLGAFSFGICGCCTRWNTAGHGTAHWSDVGTCSLCNKSTHRYDSCDKHSRENGGWGL